MKRLLHSMLNALLRFNQIIKVEVWPFVPVTKDLKDLLKPVVGHWSLNGTRHTTGGTPSFWSTANH